MTRSLAKSKRNKAQIDRKIYDRIRAALPEVGHAEVVAGVLTERYGSEPVEGTTLNYAQLMTIQEYGTRTIPARPAVTPVYESATTHNTVQKIVTAGLKDVIKDAATGSKRVRAGEKLLNKVGLYLVEQMKERIRARIDPPLAPSTIAKRRAEGREGDTPLLDTKHLINSFSYFVRGLPTGGKK